MVYTSLSLSLASIEVFVHVEPDEEPDDLISITAELPGTEKSIERVTVETLPADWRTMENRVPAAIGADWAVSMRSFVLLVPSAAVDGEWNALLNPQHPDARKLHIVNVKPFRFDPRMFKGSR